MQKANFESVKQFFEKDGWQTQVEYSECIKLHAEKFTAMPDSIDVYFAFMKGQRSGAMSADEDVREREIEDIEKYTELYGDNVHYSGTPGAVSLYEAEFGASSGAWVQAVTEDNRKQVQIKSVAAVEDAFKKAGYSVALTVGLYDKGTEIETWQVSCMSLSPMNTLAAGFGYDSEWANSIAAEQVAVASMQNQTLKTDGCWWYYGTADAVALFESFGTMNPIPLFTAAEIKVDESVAKVDAAFKAAGYTVTVTPVPGGSMLSCIVPGSADTLTAGNGDADFINMYSNAMKPAAESMGLELKVSGNWYYYGGAGSVKIIESIL
ncbi:MAG: hypothetical protein FWG44_06320 [Oscillospiraceae bacterium]|nr:hypothetical protein [Oscillospiraceae bacterium]